MKLKKLIILSLAALLFPLIAKATTDHQLNLSCDKEIIAPNTTLNCTITGTTKTSVSSVMGKIEVGENLTLVSALSNQIWEGNAVDGIIDLYAVENKTGTFAIATFSVKAGNVTKGSETYITVNNIEYSDADFNITKLNDVSIDLRISSSINTLSKLEVNGKELDLTKELTTTIDATSTEISATATDSKAKISGTGKVDLKYGDNVIEVKVTSEAGTVKTYTLTITRPDNRSAINTLANLTINGEAKDLTKELNYTIDAESVEISAASSDVKAKVSGDLGKLELKYGENTFKVKVTAENETEKVYTIKITRPGGQGAGDDKLEGDGPQTGIADYALLIGVVLVLVGAGTYVVLKKKGKFIRL